jgi:hypothetical protein
MGKIFAFILISVFFFSLSSCKNTGELQTEQTADSDSVGTQTTVKDTEDNDINGPLVTDPELLYGSWAFIEKIDKIDDFTRKTTYAIDDPDTDIYTFDQVNVDISHNGGVYFTAEYEISDSGVFTMTEKSTGARPITYTQMRLKDGILTADYEDGSIQIKMKWQKIE